MNKKLQLALGIAAGVSLAACGASSNNPSAPSNPAPIAKNVLQFAVGTANLQGTSTALNVVATYRQPAGSYHVGDSGTQLNTITLSGLGTVPGPAGSASAWDCFSTAPTGAAPVDVSTGSLTSTPQNVANAAECLAGSDTTFGLSGGVFGLGIEPWNAIGSASQPGSQFPATINSPYSVAPYQVPLLDSVAKDANAFIPWGGPPSFSLPDSNGVSPVGNSAYPGGTAGLSEGIDVFYGIVPVANNTYTLAVNVPANNGAVNVSKSATLAAVTTLPLATNPAFTPDGTAGGGGTFAFTMPAGATEAYVQVTDYGATGASAVYYTLETNASGTLTLPDNIGPLDSTTEKPTPTINAGDNVFVQVIAFDYPAYEMSYPNSNGNPAPAYTGAAGTDDLSISAPTCATTCTVTLPLLKQREFAAAYGHHAVTAQSVNRTTIKH